MENSIKNAFDALTNGVEQFGEAIIKHGILRTLFAVWCIFWGVVMIPICLILLLK